MNAFTQVRTVKTRSSATEILRKLGVHSRDYNAFIECVAGTEPGSAGVFLVNLDAAAAHLAALKAPKGRKISGKADPHGVDIDEAAALAAAKPAKKAAEPKTAKRNVTTVALAMIRAGSTNAEVFAALNAEFAIGDSKKTYPAWYRRHLMVKFGEDYSATAGTPIKAVKADVAPVSDVNPIIAKMEAVAAAKAAAKAAKKAAKSKAAE